MSSAVVLDAGPLGILCHPRNPPHAAACRQWLTSLVAAGRRVVVPEIADYELRRELIRLNSQKALVNLDLLAQQLEYLPLDTPTLRRAAELWAQARQRGQQTAADPALDCDVILAAQALSLGGNVIVATGTRCISRVLCRLRTGSRSRRSPLTPPSTRRRASSLTPRLDPGAARQGSSSRSGPSTGRRVRPFRPSRSARAGRSASSSPQRPSGT